MSRSEMLKQLGIAPRVIVTDPHTLPEEDTEAFAPAPRNISEFELEPFINREPSFWELTKAHVKDNPLRWTYLWLKNKFSGSYEDPDFQIMPEDVAGYEDFPQIMNAKNSIELMQYKKLADDIRLQRRIMAECGMGANFAAGFASGLIDPINIATGFAGAGLANAGFRLFRIAHRVGKVTNAAVSGVVSAPLDIAVRSSLEERTPSTDEYFIGASVSGLMGVAFSAAPSVARALNPSQKKRIREAMTKYQETLKEPLAKPSVDQPYVSPTEIADTHIANALGVEKLAEKISPEVSLVNSPFNEAKEFGAKMGMLPYRIKNQAGEVVSPGASVDMLSQQAIATNLQTFNGVIQHCFKDWLSESKGYGWCKSTFTNWSSYNLWSGKAWDQFSEKLMRRLQFPNELVEKPIQTAADFFKSSVEALNEKSIKAGVWDANFAALKAKWEQERNEFRRHKDRYDQAVTDIDNINAEREGVLSNLYTETERTRTEIEELQSKLERIDALQKSNKTTLSEVRAEIRKNETAGERAETSALLEEGRKQGTSKSEQFTDKTASKYEKSRSGLNEMVEREEASLKNEKQALRAMRHERPRLKAEWRALRNSIKESCKRLDASYEKLADESIDFINSISKQQKKEGITKELLASFEEVREIASRMRTLGRARLGKMSKRDRKKGFPEEVIQANNEIAALRKRLVENINALKKANVELPPKIIDAMIEIEDQAAWLERLKGELKTTTLILSPLHKIEKYNTERIAASDRKLQKIYERLETKGKIIDALTPRFVIRNRIKTALETLKEHYQERIAQLKANGAELSKIYTQLRNSQKETLRVREKLEAPTQEQLKRLSYLEGRLKNPQFTIADISNIKDPIYFPRIYNLQKIKKNRTEFVEALIKAYRAEGDQRSDEALRKSANKTADTLLHVEKTGGKNKRGQRRFELSREIDIPTYYLNDFIVKDIRVLYGQLVSTLVPDIYISKAFGTLNFEQILEKLTAEKDRKMLAAYGDNVRQQEIAKAYQTAAKDMETLWNRVRGEPNALNDQIADFFHVLKSYNILTKLGHLPLAILYDPFNMQLHVGLGRIGKQAFKLLNAREVFTDIENADPWIRAINATENARYVDLGNALTAGGRIARGMGQTANVFVKATGAPLLDTWLKRLVGHTKLEYIIRNCLKIAEGKKVRPKVIENLRSIGINKEMELRIAQEFQKHGEIKKGVYLAYADAWDEAVGDVFKSAIRKSQNMAILTPTSGSIPKGFDSVYWSTVLQFKRCLFAALSNVSVPFAQEVRDRRIGTVGKCLVAGYVGVYFKELATDVITGRKRTHEEIDASVWKSFDVLSVGTYLFNVVDLFDTQKPDYFFGEKQIINLLGPTAGFGVDVYNAGRGLNNIRQGENMSETQRRAWKRIMPFNNYLFLEMVINSFYGAKNKDNKTREYYIAE